MRAFSKLRQRKARHEVVLRPAQHALCRSLNFQPSRTHATALYRHPKVLPQTSRRYNSTVAADSSASVHIAPERKGWRAAPHRRPNEPVYELYFTCNVCKHRSGHSISKQGYHHGTTLVQCPSCKNRHLISDHLKIFHDKGMTLQDIMKEKGQSIKMGSLDAQGDVEFWDEDAANAAQGQAETGANA